MTATDGVEIPHGPVAMRAGALCVCDVNSKRRCTARRDVANHLECGIACLPHLDEVRSSNGKAERRGISSKRLAASPHCYTCGVSSGRCRTRWVVAYTTR